MFCAPAPDGENCHAAVASTLFTEVRIVLDTSKSPEVKAPLCKKWESFQCCFATQHLLYTQCDPMPGNDTDQFMGVVSNCSAHWENATVVREGACSLFSPNEFFSNPKPTHQVRSGRMPYDPRRTYLATRAVY